MAEKEKQAAQAATDKPVPEAKAPSLDEMIAAAAQPDRPVKSKPTGPRIRILER